MLKTSQALVSLCFLRMTTKTKSIGIIGSGFAGLASACYLAQAGYMVTVFDQHAQPGGRARMFESDGFKFDMGPSWYWMPDVFDKFFADFGKKTSDYYHLIQLDPGFQIIFGQNDILPIEKDIEDTILNFEKIEAGSGSNLRNFIETARQKYEAAMGDLVMKPSHSILEFAEWQVVRQTLQHNLFMPLSREVRKLFRDHRLVKAMEFPVIFLGAMADKIPALYSIMNYAAVKMGTFYPDGGMVKIPEAMYRLAMELGVQFELNSPVSQIKVENGIAKSLIAKGIEHRFDAIISSADYHHTEMKLLPEQYRNYNEEYWSTRVFAPSSMLYYLGVSKKLNNLEHHNLFFDTDYVAHGSAIYDQPAWVEEPLFYVCCPSKTDSAVAPSGHENVFILIPYAIQLTENQEIKDQYFKRVMERLEKHCGEEIVPSIVYKREFAGKEFISEYNSYRGNAYGLANTLLQTAFLKPKMKNKKIKNLMYTGQLTVPGPGVPPSLISGKIVAKEMNKLLQNQPQ